MEEGNERGKDYIAARKKRNFVKKCYTGENASNMIAKNVDDSDQLYTYNLTNFKVTELISETTYTSSQKAAITESFSQLRKLMMGSVKPVVMTMAIPAPTLVTKEVKEDIVASCEFLPPINVELCGSFVSGLALSSTTTVDVRLIVPKKFYKKKDYISQRWLTKKAYYAAVLAQRINSNSEKKKYTLQYAYPQENPLDITLLVTHKGLVTFRVFLQTEKNLFLVKVLSPEACNVKAEDLDLKTEEDADIPTPLYNHVLAVNQLHGTGEQLTADWINESEVIKQCMILTKIWMHQRALDQGFQCMNAFTVRMFMIYLLRNRLLPYHTTGHQIFISILQRIVNFNWKTPFSLKEDVTPECLASHKTVSEIVFLDPTGLVNYCAAVSQESVEQLKQHAKETVTLILRDADQSFEDTFIKKLSPHLYYDYAIRLDNISQLACRDLDRRVDSCDDAVYSCLPKLLRVVRKGLGERVSSIAVSPVLRQAVSVHSKEFSRQPANNRVVIRFHINLELINNTLERGPPADDPAAAEFRGFWGDKSDLRRFMDGAICEAVFWNAESAASKRLIYGSILNYVLKLHCNVDPKNVVYGVNQLDAALKTDEFGLDRHKATGEEEAAKFQSVFFKLSKQLRAIKSLPLGVTDVLGMDAACRNTKLFAGLPSVFAETYDTFDPERVICVVEGSKWPDSDDLEAIATLKTLMLLQIKDSLNSIESVSAFIREGALTVFQERYQFNISIMNIGELIRLRNEHTTPKARQEFSDLVVLPNISNALSGLQSEHSTYATTARLLKRFLGAHMLTSFLPEPITDLIAASVYINHRPYQVPRCSMIAFFRCLDLIVHHDWTNQPLVLNFNGELNDDALNELLEDFKLKRNRFPCATVITPTDRSAVLTRPVMPFMLKLIRDVASTCLQAANAALSVGEWSRLSLNRALFKPDLSMMDVLIELNTERSRRLPLSLQQDGKRIDVFIDPAVNYIKHVQEAYSDKAVVMYDTSSPKYIGLVWKPGAFAPVPVKRACEEMLRSARSLSQVANDLCVTLDIKSVLQDLNTVGQNIVTNITVNQLHT